MADSNDKLKETLQKKSMPEISAMILTTKKKISEEKDLLKLSRLNTELSILQEIRDKKTLTGGIQVRKTTGAAKPALKSFDDYVKSKK